MTLSARTELSHTYSYDSKIDAIFKLTLVAERRTEAKGFHHIIVLDTSKSMDGQKIELAKNGAQEYVKGIPSGNMVSVVLFSSTVQAYPETKLSEVLPKIRASGLTALADASGGMLHNITDAQKLKLPSLMQESAVNEVGARNISVDFGTPEVKILNYKGPPVSINAVETVAKIWGRVPIPAGFNGRLLNIQVTYSDTIDDKKKTISAPVEVRVARNEEQFSEGINNNLVSEFAYYQGLEEYYQHLAAGQLKEATKTMNQLSANAEQTRRTDLIEATKRLSDQHEATLRLGGNTESTNRLLKEAASETTKRTRGK